MKLIVEASYASLFVVCLFLQLTALFARLCTLPLALRACSKGTGIVFSVNGSTFSGNVYLEYSSAMIGHDYPRTDGWRSEP